jgi:hypothetical protein
VFGRTLSLVAVRVARANVEGVVRALSGVLLRMPHNARLRPVVPDTADEGFRLVLLAEGSTALDLSGLSAAQTSARPQAIRSGHGDASPLSLPPSARSSPAPSAAETASAGSATKK